MKQLAVSRKFRKSIIEKINSSFPAEAAERLISLADELMTEGIMPDISAEDLIIKSIFRYIASDIMTAIERSRKARQRAADRKQQKADNTVSEKRPKTIFVTNLGLTLVEGKDFLKSGCKFFINPNVGLSRQQRRQAERDLERIERSKHKY
ncbi:MAG: hypothetical protein NC098_08320 [Lachnoclostridium sp.]|nr:hypothetical protein [Lachnoclostridium sp.]